MHRILTYLKTHKAQWMLPMLAFLAILVWAAWKIAHTPGDPFAYRAY